jgi:histone deacetylase 1/2
VDANLYHDLTTGRSVTGILHLINGTPFDWYSKKQSTVETATYGSEFVAARTASEQMISNRIALRYLGVPIEGQSLLFGDNRSVVTSGSVPQSKLNKRHVALSYHKVRETIAAGVMAFHWMHTSENPADILSKHWARHKVADHLHQLLFMSDVDTGQDGKDKDNPES